MYVPEHYFIKLCVYVYANNQSECMRIRKRGYLYKHYPMMYIPETIYMSIVQLSCHVDI